MKTLIYPLPVPLDEIHYLSGTMFSIYNSLKNYFNVIPVGPLQQKKPVIQTGLNLLYKKRLFPYQFATVHTWKTINCYSRQLQKYLDNIEYDAVFSCSSLYAAKLKTNKPVFSYVDFSFFNGLNYYDFGKDLFPFSQKQALEVDEFCFKHYTKTFLASDWAKRETSKAYGLDDNKIVVLKRGANLEAGFTYHKINELIEKRINNNTKNFLFIGVNWKRKGGDIAVHLVTKLRDLGYDVKLQIVGCNPPDEVEQLPFVESYSFLSRKKENELSLLRELSSNAFCFILPTQAEAMGIAFAEAASFGLPCIAYDTGGVSAAIENEKTGILFNAIDSIDTMLKKIVPLLNDKNLYQKMAQNAHKKYVEELNWNSIAMRIKDIITPLL